MTHRPYPDRERALAQLHRHHPAPPPSELQLRMAKQAHLALENAGRQLRPLNEAMRQVMANAPALVAATAPVAYRFAQAVRQQTQTV